MFAMTAVPKMISAHSLSLSGLCMSEKNSSGAACNHFTSLFLFLARGNELIIFN